MLNEILNLHEIFVLMVLRLEILWNFCFMPLLYKMKWTAEIQDDG